MTTPSPSSQPHPPSQPPLAARACCSAAPLSSTRRGLLGLGAGLLGGLAATATFGDTFVQTAYAASGSAPHTLVVLSMRGAADGMSLVVPHGDPLYHQARPTIAVPTASLLAPDSFFGLHPSLAPLMPQWRAGRMAAVHAVGQIVTTRSHFTAMEEVEDADPGSARRIGWLNRVLQLNPAGAHLGAGLQLGPVALNTQMHGAAPVLAAAKLASIRVDGPDQDAWLASMRAVWASPPPALGGGATAFDLADVYSRVPASDSGTEYPTGDLAAALSSAARVIKADSGAEVITVDTGSWDHHQDVGNLSGGAQLRSTDAFAKALGAFLTDLGPAADRVTVVTITEFGRRLKENSARGLDHGHGSVMFVVGPEVRGGYHGRWSQLALTDNADLPVTTDYRDVLAEVVGAVFPERSIATVFPGLIPTPIGVMKPRPVTGEPLTPPAVVVPPGLTGTAPPVGGRATGARDDLAPAPPKKAKYRRRRFHASQGRVKGRARVGATIVAPVPVLTPAGKAAAVSVSYRWETQRGSRVTRRGDGGRIVVPRSWVGSQLRLKVIHRAPGHRKWVRVIEMGTVT